MPATRDELDDEVKSILLHIDAAEQGSTMFKPPPEGFQDYTQFIAYMCVVRYGRRIPRYTEMAMLRDELIPGYMEDSRVPCIAYESVTDYLRYIMGVMGVTEYEQV